MIDNPILYKKLTNNDPNTNENDDEKANTKHDSTVYVDDLSQIIAAKNHLDLQEETQKVYEATVGYFKANLLAINATKTEILFVPAGNEDNEEVYLMTEEGEVIKSKKVVKILGVKFNSNHNMNSHISALASTVGMNYKKIQPYIAHAPMSQRRTILKTKLEPIAMYAAPLLFNESELCKKRLENILMNVNKWIYGKTTYMKSYKEICQEIRAEPPEQVILKTNTRYICKLMFEKQVTQLMNFLKINKRTGSKVYLKEPHKASTKASLNRHIHLFNTLPLELKTLNPKRLKQKLEKLSVSFKY